MTRNKNFTAGQKMGANALLFFVFASQELIRQFYHLFNENDFYREKFEEILMSILDDLQRYKREFGILEIAHKM